MPENKTANTENTSEELKELVIARLSLIPNNVKISVGSEGEFTRAELIERVREEDSVGQEIIRSQRDFLRALGSGVFLDEILSEA